MLGIILVFILLIDIYTFKGIKILLKNNQAFTRQTVYFAFWAITAILLGMMAFMLSKGLAFREPELIRYSLFFVGFFILFYVPKLFFIVFHLSEDLIKMVSKIILKFGKPNSDWTATGTQISRSTFLSQVGIVVAFIPFVGILYGISKGRFNFNVKFNTLYFSNLPKSFDGFRIIHISDMHIGSFLGNEAKVQQAIELINEQEADLILFTGDLVNTHASELNGFVPILKQMKARFGKFSVLGNHDYGDYFGWKSQADKEANFQNLIFKHQEIGFQLLMNKSVQLEAGGEKIGIVGIENWGKPPFPQHGNYEQAVQSVEELPFKILLSHDPSFWDMQVMGKKDVDLTLSGHTHGFQLGIEIAGLKWSPAKIKYPRWAGMYQDKKQYLYVNRGFGYIGFPGRIGMPPEITLIQLNVKS